MKNKIFYISCSFVVFVCLLIFIYFNFYIEIDAPNKDIFYGEELLEEPKAYLKGHFILKNGKEIPIKKDGSINYNSLGENEISYEASFLVWKNKKIQKIYIIDNEKPIISLKGEKNHFYYKGKEYEEPGFTAYDNFDKDITNEVIIEMKGNEIFYKVKDSSGNETIEIRNLFYYKDLEFPKIDLNGEEEITLNINEEFMEPGFSASDNIEGDIISKVKTNSNLDITKEGTYSIEYVVSDSYGNTTKKKRTIIVVDKERIAFEKMQEELAKEKEESKEDKKEEVVDLIIPGKIDENTKIDVEIEDFIVTKPKEDPNKIIYLTFDDGPSQYTMQLLDILDKYNVKATFFLVNKEKYIDLIKEEYKRGHTIAIHTESHDYAKIYKNKEAYFKDLYAMQDIIEEQIGIKTYLMRFPGGSSNTVSKNYCEGIMTELSKDVENRGFTYFDWNITAGDSRKGANKESVLENIIPNIPKFKQSIILQHDTKQFSVEAVEDIIIWGLENGYTFKTLSEDGFVYHHPINN